jgi:hypothetical protein
VRLAQRGTRSNAEGTGGQMREWITGEKVFQACGWASAKVLGQGRGTSC